PSPRSARGAVAAGRSVRGSIRTTRRCATRCSRAGGRARGRPRQPWGSRAEAHRGRGESMVVIRFLFALLLGFVIGAGTTLWLVHSDAGEVVVRGHEGVEDIQRPLRQ